MDGGENCSAARTVTQKPRITQRKRASGPAARQCCCWTLIAQKNKVCLQTSHITEDISPAGWNCFFCSSHREQNDDDVKHHLAPARTHSKAC